MKELVTLMFICLFILCCNERNIEEKLYTYKAEGNYEAINDLLTQEINSDIDNAELYIDRAENKILLNDYTEAIIDCRSAILKQPNYVKAYLTLGEIFNLIGKYGQAIEVLNKADQVDRQRWHKKYYTESMYIHLKDNPDDTVLILSPFRSGWPSDLYFESVDNKIKIKEIRGLSYSKIGQLKKAIEDYNYVVFNKLFIWTGDFKEKEVLSRMINDYTLYNSTESSASIEHFNAGYLNYIDHRYQNSLSDFNRFIQKYPNNYGGYYKRAMSYIQLDRYQDALNDIKKAISLHPSGDSMYLYNFKNITPEGIKPLNQFSKMGFIDILPTKEKLIEVLQHTVTNQVLSEQKIKQSNSTNQ